jgi:hypothetical protein
VSPELRDQIEDHRNRLRRLLEAHRDLFTRLAADQPTLIEREALGAVLHSFYMGIESIMRSIAKAFDGGMQKTEDWHRALISSMTAATPGRPALLSATTAARLRAYLDFRHRFRNLYTDVLDWELMRPLVMGVQSSLADFESDLDRFLAQIPG